MYQRKQRRFRRRSNGRNHLSHNNGGAQNRLRSNSFSNGQSRNNFRPSMSPEKLFEKYTSLAKEAMSSGDKNISENYLQHADHFMRIIEDKNKNRNYSKDSSNLKPTEETKDTSKNIEADNNNLNKDNK